MFNSTGFTAGILLAALLATGAHLPAEPEPNQLTVKEVVETMENPTYAAATAELSLRLLRLTSADSTRMVSALSLSQALTLLAEGASGETLAELEGVIGLSLEDLREALPAYVASLPSTEKASFRSVNTVWAEQNGFTLNEAYANRLKSRYGAQITPISFTEKGAAAKINDWFSGATDGMINEIVDDDTAKDMTLLLVNALCFDAKWASAFPSSTFMDTFTCAGGSQVKVDFMQSKSDRLLIDYDGTLGFVKPYAGGSYSFVGLLPPEGTEIEDYLAEMSGADFVELVNSVTACDNLKIKLPVFSLDYSVTLNDALKALGVERIFDNRAELSGLGESSGRLYVDTVLQKTHIDVNTEGTRAAAVTSIAINVTAMLPPVEYREVSLDRPFIYAIIDNATSTPIFLGIVSELA